MIWTYVKYANKVAQDEDIRDASSDAEVKMENTDIELSFRKDVFDNIKIFSESDEAKSLSNEYKHYLKVLVENGRKRGLFLEKEKREDLKITEKRISELSTAFFKCLNEDSSHIFVTEKNLSGVPRDVLNSMEKDETGRFKVTTNAHYDPVITSCNNPKTRFLLEKSFQSRCLAENSPRIKELIVLRNKKAAMLGNIM